MKRNGKDLMLTKSIQMYLIKTLKQKLRRCQSFLQWRLISVRRLQPCIKVQTRSIFVNHNENLLCISLGTSTIICIKNVTVDRFVSGGILSFGVFEGPLVVGVMKAMDLYPEAVFFDIGANIGRYRCTAS